MLGAIIGDIVGSRFEFVKDDNRGKDFKLFGNGCRITDDSLMTLAVAKALYLCRNDYSNLKKTVINCMVDVAEKHPNTSWGINFHKWLFEDKSHSPYNSFGNGAGMRISPVGFVANSEEEVKELSKVITEVSHNHIEGIKGAEAIAMGVYLARIGKSKDEIRKSLSTYYPKLLDKDFTINSLQSSYGYDEWGDWISCQGSVPQAIVAFLDSESFEDAIRNAVSIGGDSDTIGAMTGGLAEAFYGIPNDLQDKAMEYLTDDLKSIYYAFTIVRK